MTYPLSKKVGHTNVNKGGTAYTSLVPLFRGIGAFFIENNEGNLIKEANSYARSTENIKS